MSITYNPFNTFSNHKSQSLLPPSSPPLQKNYNLLARICNLLAQCRWLGFAPRKRNGCGRSSSCWRCEFIDSHRE